MAKKTSGKRKRRVAFRRNRQRPARQKQWSVPAEDDVKADLATPTFETVQAKGELSRRRTVIEAAGGGQGPASTMLEGTVVAARGRFVEVDDGQRRWPCTMRRILRTRRIRERQSVVVGDRVRFSIVADSEGVLTEGVIEQVCPRRTSLSRCDGRRTHTIAANVDQVLIVTSIREPMIKPHLIDRYLVAAHAGNLSAVICVNKVDLDPGDECAPVVHGYRRLGYAALATSATAGIELDALTALLADKVTLLVGQSGVGKSSLLNAIQPGLDLRTARVSAATEKGRHTTSTALWLPLDPGGAVIDTPGIRALDVAMVPLNELEMHFVEFVDRIRHCKYPNCIHIHEDGCAIRSAVDTGEIDRARYDSYEQLFYELSETNRRAYE